MLIPIHYCSDRQNTGEITVHVNCKVKMRKHRMVINPHKFEITAVFIGERRIDRMMNKAKLFWKLLNDEVETELHDYNITRLEN